MKKYRIVKHKELFINGHGVSTQPVIAGILRSTYSSFFGM